MANTAAPNHNNPWDVAPKLSQGDANGNAIFTAVGVALTQWEQLDDVLANLFGILVGSRKNAAKAAYGTVSSSSGRLEMISTAAKIVLRTDPDLLADLTKLVNEVGKLGGRRNEIAHGSLVQYTSIPFQGVQTEHGCFLVPPSYATRKRAKEVDFSMPMFDGAYAYTSAQILAYAKHFRAYERKTRSLIQRAQAHFDVPTPPKSPQPKAGPPSPASS